VQSHWFSVGSVVTWAEAGVGAVATQSMVEVSYGPLGLELMRAGKTPQQALTSLLASDEGRALRQVAMVNVSGQMWQFIPVNAALRLPVIKAEKATPSRPI
jgi:uncharacterized Ntn-hydrolase superfamily protein